MSGKPLPLPNLSSLSVSGVGCVDAGASSTGVEAWTCEGRIYDGGSSLAGSVRSTREAVATEPTIQSYKHSHSRLSGGKGLMRVPTYSWDMLHVSSSLLHEKHNNNIFFITSCSTHPCMHTHTHSFCLWPIHYEHLYPPPPPPPPHTHPHSITHHQG